MHQYAAGTARTMSTNKRLVQATPDQVWSVLADGWLYPLWVVGASRMREVDAEWPEPGARLHHSVGTWPLLIDDTTEVVESNPGATLTLRARAWPSGEAGVTLHLRPNGTGGPASLLMLLLHAALATGGVWGLGRSDGAKSSASPSLQRT